MSYNYHMLKKYIQGGCGGVTSNRECSLSTIGYDLITHSRPPIRQSREKILIVIKNTSPNDRIFIDLAVKHLLNPDNYTIYNADKNENLLDILIEQNLYYHYKCAVTNFPSDTFIDVFEYCKKNNIVIFSTSVPHPLMVAYPSNIIHVKNYKFIVIFMVIEKITNIKQYSPTTHFDITDVTIVYSESDLNEREVNEMGLLNSIFLTKNDVNGGINFVLINTDVVDVRTMENTLGDDNVNSNAVFIVTKSTASTINRMSLKSKLLFSQKLTYLSRIVDKDEIDVDFTYGLYVDEADSELCNKFIDRFNLSYVSDSIKIIPDLLTRIGEMYLSNNDKIQALSMIHFMYCLTLDRNVFWDPSVISFVYINPEESDNGNNLDFKFVISIEDIYEYDNMFHGGTSVPEDIVR